MADCAGEKVAEWDFLFTFAKQKKKGRYRDTPIIKDFRGPRKTGPYRKNTVITHMSKNIMYIY